jgi:2-haloacid dehalogenase
MQPRFSAAPEACQTHLRSHMTANSRSALPRRDFVRTLGGVLAMSAFPQSGRRMEPSGPKIRAVAFDGYAVFDPTPVGAVAESVAPTRGRELVAAWRTHLFEYQWLRTLGGRYVDFRQTADDALTFATKSTGIALRGEERERLLDAQLRLTAWPDAALALQSLRASGLRLAFLSNMTEHMLDDGARRAGIRDAFEFVLSTDRVRAAKPDPRAYQMAVDAFGIPREQIAFVAFAGWDAAGAAWFGYPTVWTNRLGAPVEELGVAPAAIGRDLSAVESFVKVSGGM